MAYKAEIAVNVRGLKDVKTLETSLNKISGKIGVINKLSAGNSKAVRVEKQVLNSKAAQADMMSKTRRIGDLVQKQADKGLKVGLAQEAISKSALLNSKKEFAESKRLQKVALDELKIQKAISKEIGQQAALKGKAGGSLAGGPFVSTGVSSSRFGSVGQPGSPRFIASRAGAIQGPADPPFAPGMFPSSPIGGSKFMFGSPAQRAFSGGPSSSILGSKTTFGSPKFFDAAAKAGGPSVPVRGSKDLFGSPAYYDAANKEALRIAKANAMPIKGFKTLPGSPAFHEEQAKRLKRLRGASTGFSAAEFGPQQPMQGPAMGPTSMGLNFDKRTGKLLRGPAGSGGGGFRNLARRFDRQSALISGGFPLLFGQGPGVAAAGALGGGIGGMFGQMGGFAGGIAATAIVQSIQNAINAISELGQAMGPFTQNTKAVTDALGLQGSAEEARIKLIEQTKGKTAAFNAAMNLMSTQIGQKGVDAIRQFGDSTRLLGGQFTLALTKLQAFTAAVANFIIRITGLQDQLEEDAATQTVAAAAGEGNLEAKALVDRRKAAESLRGQGGEGARKKALLDQISAEEKIFAIRRNTTIEADNLTQKFDALGISLKAEKEESQRILELRKKGINPELAKTLASIEKEGTIAKDNLQVEIDKLLDKQAKEGELDKKLQTRLTTLEKIQDEIDEEIDSMSKLAEETDKLNDSTKNLKSNFEKIGESIASGVSDNLVAAIQGTKTLGEAAKSILNDLSSTLLRLGVNTLLGQIPGFTSLLPRAKGGPVSKGGSFLVGEKGPELFVPKRSGTIIPNDKLGGGSTNISVNVDASGSSVQGDNESGKELGRLISVAIQSELLKQRRPGGLLR